MLRKRIIVSLEIRDGQVVQSVRGQDLRDPRHPAEVAVHYEAEGADEVVFLDVSDSVAGRRLLLDGIRHTAERLSIPLAVGGGVSELDEIHALLRAGADKVNLNTAAVERPILVQEAAQRFGTQCVIVSVDAKIERRKGEMSADQAGQGVFDEQLDELDWYRVFTHGASRPTMRNALAWAQQCVELGAGEILLTSIDRDGRREGYDLELTARVVERVPVPVIASGGAGKPEHMRDAFVVAGADAVLASGIFHERVTTVAEVKRQLSAAGVPVRPAASSPQAPTPQPSPV